MFSEHQSGASKSGRLRVWCSPIRRPQSSVRLTWRSWDVTWFYTDGRSQSCEVRTPSPLLDAGGLAIFRGALAPLHRNARPARPCVDAAGADVRQDRAVVGDQPQCGGGRGPLAGQAAAPGGQGAAGSRAEPGTLRLMGWGPPSKKHARTTDRQADRRTEHPTDRVTDRPAARPPAQPTDRRTAGPPDRQTTRQTDRWPNRRSAARPTG